VVDKCETKLNKSTALNLSSSAQPVLENGGCGALFSCRCSTVVDFPKADHAVCVNTKPISSTHIGLRSNPCDSQSNKGNSQNAAESITTRTRGQR